MGIHLFYLFFEVKNIAMSAADCCVADEYEPPCASPQPPIVNRAYPSIITKMPEISAKAAMIHLAYPHINVGRFTITPGKIKINVGPAQIKQEPSKVDYPASTICQEEYKVTFFDASAHKKSDTVVHFNSAPTAPEMPRSLPPRAQNLCSIDDMQPKTSKKKCGGAPPMRIRKLESCGQYSVYSDNPQ